MYSSFWNLLKEKVVWRSEVPKNLDDQMSREGIDRKEMKNAENERKENRTICGKRYQQKWNSMTSI
jgi:hypothetical protein